jgi:predicted nuclease of restriction endonuclease-like (RecB) superfamily
MAKVTMNIDRLVGVFRRTHVAMQQRAVHAVDAALVARNWLFGRYIVEYEQEGCDRARYGKRIIPLLSERLAAQGLRGLSPSYLWSCRQFYDEYRILQTVSGELPRTGNTNSRALAVAAGKGAALGQGLSGEWWQRFRLNWSNYLFLMTIPDRKERAFYEIEADNAGWSLRELRRQFDSSLYERLALSRDKARVRKLSRCGATIEAPVDLVKDPYVLEFLDLEERPAYTEKELESAILGRLQQFLLELGKGFLFQARQYRLSFDDRHFRVDLVFYNRILRCFVLVDLKIGELAHQDIGQMQMYVNYFDRKLCAAGENPTIGIVLCRTKSDALVEMTLPRGNDRIFASKYQLYLPSKEELRAQISVFHVPEHKGRSKSARSAPRRARP